MAQKRPVGRPRAKAQERHFLRFSNPADKVQWVIAAATCGMSLNEWIAATLNGEAGKATHVPMAHRAGRRG